MPHVHGFFFVGFATIWTGFCHRIAAKSGGGFCAIRSCDLCALFRAIVDASAKNRPLLARTFAELLPRNVIIHRPGSWYKFPDKAKT